MLLFLAIIIGFVFPQIHVLSFIIKYLLMIMLFSAFLSIEINKSLLNIKLPILFISNILFAFVAYYCISYFHRELALIVFISIIGPSATASPAIISLLKGNLQFITAQVLLSNILTALTLPYFISLIYSSSQTADTFPMIRDILIIILAPFIVAQIIKNTMHHLHTFIIRSRLVAFDSLVLVICIAVSQSSFYIRSQQNIPISYLVIIAFTVLSTTILCWALGRAIGGKKYALEAGQGLGNKNTVLMTWFALNFINPLVALGPVLYLVFDSSYNSYQLYKAGTIKKKKK